MDAIGRNATCDEVDKIVEGVKRTMNSFCGGYKIERNDFDKFLAGIEYKDDLKLQVYEQDNILIGFQQSEKEGMLTKNDKVLVFAGTLYNACDSERKGTSLKEEIIQYVEDGEDLNELYGSFAFGIISDEQIVLVRDYPGVVPLFYVHSGCKFAFSNDSESLNELNIGEISVVKPGSKLIYSIRNQTVREEVYFNVKTVKISDPVEQLDHLLMNVTGEMYRSIHSDIDDDQEIAVFLSGGVDSSLISYYISRFHKNVRALTIDGSDNKFASKVIDKLQIKHTFLKISDEEWKENSSLMKRQEYNECYYDLTNSLFLPNYFLSRKMREMSIDIAFSGTGSDEVFVSYNRHLMYMKDLSYATKIILDDCHAFLLDATYMASKKNGVSFIMPFFSKEIINFALALPEEMRINNSIEKWIVRRVAEKYLPKEVAWREPGPLQVTTNSFEQVTGKSYYESFYW